MEFRILGPIEIVGATGTLDIPDPDQRALLAFLALHPGGPAGPPEVAAALWRHADADAGRRRAGSCASQLNVQLQRDGGAVRIGPDGYTLDADPIDVDAHRFEAEVTAADAEDDPARRLARLDGALELWRGAALAEFEGTSWAEREATRLGSLRRQALLRRCALLLELGRDAEAAAHLAPVESSAHPHDAGPVITFLFTDIEDSTRLWADFPDTMHAALEHHDALLDEAVVANGGTVLKHTGDGVNAVFTDPCAAVRGAVDAQVALVRSSGAPPELRARMGLHTGPVLERDGDYFGMAPNMTARLRDAGHGGQILVSAGAVRGIADGLPDDIRVAPLGLHRLRGIPGDHRIYQVVHRDLRRRLPPPRTLDAAAPVAVPDTSFVGRGEELTRLGALIERPGTVTLVGPGGVGKTRLAVEVAADAAHRFRDGVRMIDLAPAGADAVPAVVAAGLGLVRRGKRSFSDSVIDWLGRKHILLVVDNCEHVVDVVGPLVREVSAATSEVTVLCTSRQPLGFLGEVTLPVQPLALPEPGVAVTPEGSPAVRLFVERAEAARPGWRVAPDQLNVIAQICKRLDGIPLAVELAAARARSMSLHDLAAHLDVASPLLATATPDHPRHGTLRETIQWSYDLLTPRQQALFGRLSVFSGSWTVAAARAVCAEHEAEEAVLATLADLADRSMIVAEFGQIETRYRMLATLRDFATDRLTAAGDTAERRAKHAEFYTRFAEAAEQGLRTSDELGWVTQVTADLGNLHAAHLWAIERRDADLAARLLVSLWNYGLQRLSAENFRWVDEAMAALRLEDHMRAPELLGAAALGAWMRGDLHQCMRTCRAAFDAEERLGTGMTLPARMAILLAAAYSPPAADVELQAFTAEVPGRFLEVVAWSRALGDPFWLAYSMSTGSHGMVLSGEPERAVALAGRAEAVARQSACPTLVAWALFSHANALEQSEAARAEALLDEGVGAARGVRSNLVLGVSLALLATLRRRLGHPFLAVPLLLELVDRWDRLGTIPQLWHTIREAAMCLGLLGADQPAARLLAAVERAELVMPLHPVDRPQLAAITEQLRERLGADGFAEAGSAGAALTREAATVLATRALMEARDREPVPA
jgi:predicted ATPase/class 3 adenylate cyclase